MKKTQKFIPALLVLVFFIFNTRLSVYAEEKILDHSEVLAATPSEAANSEILDQEPLSTFTVAFDPDDGITTYVDFFKVTVPGGKLISTKPSVPKRNGYLFKGWYGFLDDHNEPVLWNFNTDTVKENTTLWAFWEEACLVAFDPDDGTTGYGDFFKAVVPSGGLVTSMPKAPRRDGYIFTGWYSYLDDSNKPVFWNFDTDKVYHNITLWAAWKEDIEKEITDGGDENKINQNGGGDNSSSNSKKKDSPASAKTSISKEDDPVLEEQTSVIIEKTQLEENMINNNKLDSMPKTGNLAILRYGINMTLSLLLLPVLLFQRKKER